MPELNSQSRLKLKCIACEALARIVYYCAAYSPHTIDVSLLQIGLHDTPHKLRQSLQDEIDKTLAGDYDALLLAYGLCGKATEGITARDIPIVMPRAHDCITLFLGSRERYDEQFSLCPGTYWYSQDYLERSGRYGSAVGLGAGLSDRAETYAEYVKKYGQDNADYLMQVMSAWQTHYQRAAMIDMGIIQDDAVETRATKEAQSHGWVYERIQGDIILIRRLLNADWNTDFLTLPPGCRVKMAGPGDIIQAVKGNEGE